MKKYEITREAESYKIKNLNILKEDFPLSFDFAHMGTTLNREVGASSVATTVTRDLCPAFHVEGEHNMVGNKTRVYLHTEFIFSPFQAGVEHLNQHSVRNNVLSLSPSNRTRRRFGKEQFTPIKAWYESEQGEMLARCTEDGCKAFINIGLVAPIDAPEGVIDAPEGVRGDFEFCAEKCSKHSEAQLRHEWHISSTRDNVEMMGKRTKKALSAVRVEFRNSETLAGWTFRKAKSSSYGGQTGAMRNHSESVYLYPPKSLTYPTPELHELIVKTHEMMTAQYHDNKDDRGEKTHTVVRHAAYAIKHRVRALESGVNECNFFKEYGTHTRMHEPNPHRWLWSTLSALEYSLRNLKANNPDDVAMNHEYKRIVQGYHDIVTGAIAKVEQVVLRSNLSVSSYTNQMLFLEILKTMSEDNRPKIDIRIENHCPTWETMFNDEKGETK